MESALREVISRGHEGLEGWHILQKYQLLSLDSSQPALEENQNRESGPSSLSRGPPDPPPTSLWAAELDSQKRCTLLKVTFVQSERPLRKVPEDFSVRAGAPSSSIAVSGASLLPRRRDPDCSSLCNLTASTVRSIFFRCLLQMSMLCHLYGGMKGKLRTHFFFFCSFPVLTHSSQSSSPAPHTPQGPENCQVLDSFNNGKTSRSALNYLTLSQCSSSMRQMQQKEFLQL